MMNYLNKIRIKKLNLIIFFFNYKIIIIIIIMIYKRHQKFWLETEKKWNKKWFKFITSISNVYWANVTENPNLTMEFIEKNPEYDWDWDWDWVCSFR
jgi:hypothetical protein